MVNRYKQYYLLLILINIEYLQILEIIQKPLSERTIDDEEILNTYQDTVQKISQRYINIFSLVYFRIHIFVSLLYFFNIICCLTN